MSTSFSSQSPSTTPNQDSSTPTLPPNPPSPNTLQPKPNSPFTPTPSDVLSLRHTLLHFLPLELANIIITYAEYWPVLTTSREAFDGPAIVTAQTGKEERDEGWCYAVSPEVPTLADVCVKVERVTFIISVFYEKPSEGECEGESTGANSRLEATILTSPSPPPPPNDDDHLKYPETSSPTPLTPTHPTTTKRWHIQSNRCMTSERVYDLTWDSDGLDSDTPSTTEGRGFVDLLKSGDRVGVMCRGLYRGWVNCIYTVRVDVYYSV